MSREQSGRRPADPPLYSPVSRDYRHTHTGGGIRHAPTGPTSGPPELSTCKLRVIDDRFPADRKRAAATQKDAIGSSDCAGVAEGQRSRARITTPPPKVALVPSGPLGNADIGNWRLSPPLLQAATLP